MSDRRLHHSEQQRHSAPILPHWKLGNDSGRLPHIKGCAALYHHGPVIRQNTTVSTLLKFSTQTPGDRTHAPHSGMPTVCIPGKLQRAGCLQKIEDSSNDEWRDTQYHQLHQEFQRNREVNIFSLADESRTIRMNKFFAAPARVRVLFYIPLQ